jgi:cysteinyl-tRNA synthetase
MSMRTMNVKAASRRWWSRAILSIAIVAGAAVGVFLYCCALSGQASAALGRTPAAAGSGGDADSGLRLTGILTFTPVATTHLPIVLNDSRTVAEPMSLADVAYWAYQLQDISAQGAVDGLVASHYDMLVLEPTRTDWSSDDRYFDTRGMVARLKGSQASDDVHRKLIIAYADIGEAEDWRWYWTWSTDWDCVGDPPADWPDYILACDPDGWSGNYPVAYWDEDWKDIIITGTNQGGHPDRDYSSVIDEVIKDGFDGIYLDWVEGYENEDVVAAAQAAGKDPAVEMIAFIEEMRAYATARNPDFLIVQQNAAALIDGHPELFTVIDAIAQEAIWYDGDATDAWDDPDGYDWENDSDLVDYYIGYLDRYLGAGLPVFDCEYALNYASTAYANSLDRGYVPYVTRRSLSRLTTTPPPGY